MIGKVDNHVAKMLTSAENMITAYSRGVSMPKTSATCSAPSAAVVTSVIAVAVVGRLADVISEACPSRCFGFWG